MLVRPQSTAQFPTTVETLGAGGAIEPAPTADAPPISALFDGVPVLGHHLLNGRVTFDDPDDLAPLSVVTERRHGTEMASLIQAGEGVPVYQEVRQRLGIQPQVTGNAP